MDATEWDARYAGTELVWSADPNRFVADIVGPWPAGRAVDLACGEGRNAIWLARRGWIVTGLDFSAVAIDKARRLASSQGVDVTWEVADATTHHLGRATTDLALVCYLQLAQAPLSAALARAAEALAPGGAVVVVAHALDNLAHGVGGPQDPSVLQTPEQIVAALPGLAVERAELARRPVPIGDDVRDAIDVIVVARRPSAR